MAGLDQESDVCIHEWNGHGHRGTIWEDEVGVLTELLDEGEDIIPSSTVQPRAVFTKLIDDLLIIIG